VDIAAVDPPDRLSDPGCGGRATASPRRSGASKADEPSPSTGHRPRSRPTSLVRDSPVTSPPPRPSLLDLDGVAARLNLSTRHVRRLVAERRIPFLKVGSLLRFDPEQIELWLRSLVVCSFDLPPGN